MRLALSNLILVFALSASAGAPEYRVIDSTGTEVLFPRAPKRVVPLLPSLAEIADRVGVPASEIVGVTAYTDYPLALRKKPSVGPYVKPNLEAIAALRPDLILASPDGTPKAIVERLRRLGYPVVTVRTGTVAELRDAFSLVGTAVGRAAEGSAARDDFDREFGQFHARAKGRPKIRVLLQVGEDPLVVAAGKTFLHEGVAALGAANIYPDPAQAYPRVSVEDVLAKDPEVIVLIGMEKDPAQLERAHKRWNSFPKLTATRNRKVILLHSDAVVRPGPRFLAGLKELERAIYPPAEKSSP